MKTRILTDTEARLPIASPEYRAILAQHNRIGVRDPKNPTRLLVVEYFADASGTTCIAFDEEPAPPEVLS